MKPSVTWYVCPRCEVLWRGAADCWSCGRASNHVWHTNIYAVPSYPATMIMQAVENERRWRSDVR